MIYKQILQHNRHYATEQTLKDPNYFKNLSTGQNPTYLLIGCSDSRVPPEVIIETNPGEVFATRNIANQVHPCDFNVTITQQNRCKLSSNTQLNTYTYLTSS